MADTHELVRALTGRALRRLASDVSFERGQSYFLNGNVRSVVEHAGVLTASVSGTGLYRVRLSAEAGELLSECPCPMGAEGAFCKHCVAVGLAWLAGRNKGSRHGEPPIVTLDDARAYLSRQSKERLVELLLEQAAGDERLRERLLMQAAKTADGAWDTEAAGLK